MATIYNRNVAASRDNNIEQPPCPTLTLSVDVSSDPVANDAAFLALPAKPGVLIIEDDSGGTLSLLQTADLRRAARVRLGPIDPEQGGRSRRADLRPLAKRVLACTVGSSFEADWATLQLARVRLPHSYKSMLDRWQAWFVHCDDRQPFPQWVKTPDPSSASGIYAGPFADKHAAARYREMLEDAFDLCRFQHILVQAPNGSACAYKEMGRCPAPCDGTVSMQQYRQQVRDSIDFARDARTARTAIESQMADHGAAMNFEAAARSKTLLERTAICQRSEFAHVRDFDSFRFLAVLPSEADGVMRVLAIVGGWIAPVGDVSATAESSAIDGLIQHAREVGPRTLGRSVAEIENIGLACRHLLLPKAQAKRRRAEFLHWNGDRPSASTIKKAIARVMNKSEETAPEANPAALETELEIGQ